MKRGKAAGVSGDFPTSRASLVIAAEDSEAVLRALEPLARRPEPTTAAPLGSAGPTPRRGVRAGPALR
jgi:hypothetical protein